MSDDEKVEFGVADQDYGGEFRYADKSPQELRRLLEAETNPAERDAIERTLMVFQAKGWAGSTDDPKATTAGEPYRGEPKTEARPESIGEMVARRKPASHIFADEMRRDALDAGIVSGDRELPEQNGEGLGMTRLPTGAWEEH